MEVVDGGPGIGRPQLEHVAVVLQVGDGLPRHPPGEHAPSGPHEGAHPPVRPRHLMLQKTALISHRVHRTLFSLSQLNKTHIFRHLKGLVVHSDSGGDGGQLGPGAGRSTGLVVHDQRLERGKKRKLVKSAGMLNSK